VCQIGLETLQERRERQDIALVHKYMTTQNQNLFIRSGGNGGARTRTAAGLNGLAVQYAWTDVRKHSFTVRAVEQWNSLRVRLLQKETQGRKRKNESYQYN
jgi:hypothetical protein